MDCARALEDYKSCCWCSFCEIHLFIWYASSSRVRETVYEGLWNIFSHQSWGKKSEGAISSQSHEYALWNYHKIFLWDLRVTTWILILLILCFIKHRYYVCINCILQSTASRCSTLSCSTFEPSSTAGGRVNLGPHFQSGQANNRQIYVEMWSPVTVELQGPWILILHEAQPSQI